MRFCVFKSIRFQVEAVLPERNGYFSIRFDLNAEPCERGNRGMQQSQNDCSNPETICKDCETIRKDCETIGKGDLLMVDCMITTN